MRETLQKEEKDKICKENTGLLRKITVIKAKRNILENYSLRTLPRKNFCASHLSIYYFSLFPCHPKPIKSVICFVEA